MKPSFDAGHDRYQLGTRISVSNIPPNWNLFLHVCKDPLAPNTIFDMSFFDQAIAKPYDDQRQLVADIFEQIRCEINPSLPSRNRALYTWTCPKCAHLFRSDRYHREDFYIYIVTLSPESVMFCGDMLWWDVACQIARDNLQRDYLESHGADIPLYSSPREGIADCVSRYWAGETVFKESGSQRIEALVVGALKILGEWPRERSL